MKIKSVSIASSMNPDERISQIFTQLGAKEKTHNGQSVLSLFTTPAVMDTKVDIAFESLRRLGYDGKSQAMSHFWYLTDLSKKLPTITIESQGKEGFVVEKHEYLIWW